MPASAAPTTPFQRFDRWLFPGARSSGDTRTRWISLLYLLFLFAPALVPWANRMDTSWTLTLLSIALFLPLYLVMCRYADRRGVMACLTTAALGCALLPYNQFANTYVIYACAGAVRMPRATMWTVIALSLGVFAATVSMTSFPPGIGLFLFGLTALIALLATVSNRLLHVKAEKQAQLELSQEETRRLAALAERERIGRDLHDLLGHTLSVIAIKSELAARLFERDPAGAEREIRDVERIARDSLGQVRSAVAGMRAPGLETELANARLALAAVDVAFEHAIEAPPLRADSEQALALALREAVTNVVRHARATRVEAALERDGEHLTLTVRDDGRGGASPSGNGLTGMRERLEALGGALGIVSLSGKGTELRARVPNRTPVDVGARPALRAVR